MTTEHGKHPEAVPVTVTDIVPVVQTSPPPPLPDPNRTYGIPNMMWIAMINGLLAVALAWVAKDVKADITDMKTTGESTHALVNAKAGAILRRLSERDQKMADLTGKAEDIETARLSKQDYLDHIEGQKSADAGRDKGR